MPGPLTQRMDEIQYEIFNLRSLIDGADPDNPAIPGWEEEIHNLEYELQELIDQQDSVYFEYGRSVRCFKCFLCCFGF